MWLEALVKAHGSANVLVVDDDASLLRLVSLVLTSEGFDVTCALGGAEGLKSLGLQWPNVVLLDLSMPEIDGRTFYREARDVGYLGPVMICSAHGAQAAQSELGADGFIDKPFDPDVLVRRLRLLLAAN
jgi:DNA-binding response OmpR family regulator